MPERRYCAARRPERGTRRLLHAWCRRQVKDSECQITERGVREQVIGRGSNRFLFVSVGSKALRPSPEQGETGGRPSCALPSHSAVSVAPSHSQLGLSVPSLHCARPMLQ